MIPSKIKVVDNLLRIKGDPWCMDVLEVDAPQTIMLHLEMPSQPEREPIRFLLHTSQFRQILIALAKCLEALKTQGQSLQRDNPLVLPEALGVYSESIKKPIISSESETGGIRVSGFWRMDPPRVQIDLFPAEHSDAPRPTFAWPHDDGAHIVRLLVQIGNELFAAGGR